MPDYSSIIKKFSNVNVLVVGDVMLDRYFWGSVERISPEAPVPVVKLQKNSLVVGGAANVAANIAGLGANSYLVGITGNDEEAKLFAPLLKGLNINPGYLVKIKNRPTTVKTRIVAHNQHVVRIDQEVNTPINEKDETIIWRKIEKIFEKADIIIVSDYAKGLITENLLTRLITKAEKFKKMILVDPKGKDYMKYAGAALLTPNRYEAIQACGFEGDDSSLVEQAGEKLVNKFDFGSVLITRGEEGMTLFRNDKNPFHLEASARKVFDVTGAGDTVIAALGVCLGSGTDIETAAKMANMSAGIVVEEVGTTTINLDKLKNYLKI